MTGPVPLSIGQLGQLGRQNPVAHLSISRAFSIAPDVRYGQMELAMAAVCEKHDAFGIEFNKTRGEWTQYLRRAGGGFLQLGSSGGRDPAALRSLAIPEVANLRARLKIDSAPLMAGTFFESENATPGVLLLTFSHLILDYYSLIIFIAELRDALRRILSPHTERNSRRPSDSFESYTSELHSLIRATDDDEVDRLYNHVVRVNEALSSADISRPEKPPTLGSRLSYTQTVPGRVIRWELVQGCLLAALVRAFGTYKNGTSHLAISCGTSGRQFFSSHDLTATIGYIAISESHVLRVADDETPETVVSRVMREIKGRSAIQLATEYRRALIQNRGLESQNLYMVTFNYVGRADSAAPGVAPEDELITQLPWDLGIDGDADAPEQFAIPALGMFATAGSSGISLTVRWNGERYTNRFVRSRIANTVDIARTYLAELGAIVD